MSSSEIRIASPKNGFLIIVLSIWLSGWTVGGASAIRHLLLGNAEAEQLLAIWLCFWLVGELLASYVFLWWAFGQEVISVELGIMRIKRSIFGYGLSKEYLTAKISNIRASGISLSMADWDLDFSYLGISGGTVGFDYDGKPRWFGMLLGQDDANRVATSLKNRIGRY